MTRRTPWASLILGGICLGILAAMFFASNLTIVPSYGRPGGVLVRHGTYCAGINPAGELWRDDGWVCFR